MTSLKALWPMRRLPSNRVFYLAGVDEAGRGPLAGPVVAACVLLSTSCPEGVFRDSKKLSARQREKLFQLLQQRGLAKKPKGN